METLGGVGEGGNDAQPDDPEDDDDQADDQPCGRRHPSLKGRVGDAEGDGENDDEAGGDDGGEGRGTPQDVEEVDMSWAETPASTMTRPVASRASVTSRGAVRGTKPLSLRVGGTTRGSPLLRSHCSCSTS